jgi:hypothetical protein
MYLDAAEEKMLRAIVHSAVVEAAAGRSFVGEFHKYAISASCLHVNEQGCAQVDVSIARAGRILIQMRCPAIPVTDEERRHEESC